MERQEKKIFASHVINNAYIFYLSVINDSALSSVVPLLGCKTYLKLILKIPINRTEFLIVVLPNKSLLVHLLNKLCVK